MECTCPYCGSSMYLEEVHSYYGVVDYEWVCYNDECESNKIEE